MARVYFITENIYKDIIPVTRYMKIQINAKMLSREQEF